MKSRYNENGIIIYYIWCLFIAVFFSVIFWVVFSALNIRPAYVNVRKHTKKIMKGDP